MRTQQKNIFYRPQNNFRILTIILLTFILLASTVYAANEEFFFDDAETGNASSNGWSSGAYTAVPNAPQGANIFDASGTSNQNTNITNFTYPIYWSFDLNHTITTGAASLRIEIRSNASQPNVRLQGFVYNWGSSGQIEWYDTRNGAENQYGATPTSVSVNQYAKYEAFFPNSSFVKANFTLGNGTTFIVYEGQLIFPMETLDFWDVAEVSGGIARMDRMNLTSNFSAAAAAPDNQPNASIPTFSPTAPKDNETVTANSTFTDDDGDSDGTMTWAWTVNGTSVFNETDTSVSNNDAVTSTLTSGNYTEGDTVNVTITPNDGQQNGDTQSNSFIAASSSIPPTPPSQEDKDGEALDFVIVMIPIGILIGVMIGILIAMGASRATIIILLTTLALVSLAIIIQLIGLL